MTEILTESFCERCGTRYTFQTAAPSKGRMKRLKVLSRGLRNYVLSDETSLEEAFADARSDEERAISSEQLDAFHQTFNFCMSCRQYTCANCWNGGDNLCLTCAPDLSREVLPAAFPDLDPMAGMAPLELPIAGGTPANEDRAALAIASAWPDVDLAREEPAAEAIAEATAASASFEAPAEGEAIRAAGISATEAVEAGGAVEAVAAMEPSVAPATEPEAVVEPEAPSASPTPAPGVAPIAAAPSVAPVPQEAPIGHDERAAAAAAQTAALLARFRPDRDLDAALAAYEQERVEAPTHDAEAVAEVAAASPEMPTVEPEREIAEPLTAAALAAAAFGTQAVAAEPEPVVEPAEPEPAPAAAPEPAVTEAMPAAAAPAEPVAAEAPAEPVAATPERRDDRVEIPTWRIVAPDTTSTQPSARPPAITPSTTPAWPPLPSSPTDANAPQWPAAAFIAQPAARARDAMWAASSLELVEKAGGGVQACVSCGLPLSATARFCRRCGSRQG